MIEAQPQVVRSFLAQLEAALAGVPAEVGGEILSGIREEFAGLDAATAASRIEELGDPAFIAAEARAGTGSSTAAPVTGDARWYIVLASLLIAFGGFVIPVLGWIGGIGMVWPSKSWRSWEKWTATLMPAALLAIALLIEFVLGSGGGLTWWHIAILLGILSTIPVGLWLLWRALHRQP